MSDQLQQSTEEQERWTLERCIEKMERNVVKGSALQQILKAEAAAAIPQQTEQEIEHDRH